jgi:hypothetical protein
MAHLGAVAGVEGGVAEAAAVVIQLDIRDAAPLLVWEQPMSQLKTTDARLGAALESSTRPVVVHGADGRILGVYTPVDRGALQPRINEEELRRREVDETVAIHTTDEVLAKLRAL